MTRLFVLPETPGDQPLELTDKLIVVGREPDNLLQIEDQNVSKHHALLIKVDDTYHVFDLHSANGTYVNDEAVASAKLKDGDVLRFGPGTFRFENRAAVHKIGLKPLAKVPAAPPAAPVAPPPSIPLPAPPPLIAAAPPQPLKAIPRKPQVAPIAAATPAPVVAPPSVPPPAPAAPVGLGARPVLRKPVAPAPVATPPVPSFPAGADAKETASATIPSPPPEEVAPPVPEEPAKPSPSGEIPQERTLRFKPSGSGGEVRLRLKK